MVGGFVEYKFFIEKGVTVFTWLQGGLEEASPVLMVFGWTVK